MNIKFNKIYKNIILFIFVSLYILILFNKNYYTNFSNINVNIKPEIPLNPDEIYYKGKKILKSKLLENYLFGIPNAYRDEKNLEIKRFKKYFYFADYSNDLTNKEVLKSKILKFVSIKKNQTVTQLDIFYISNILAFGNNMIQLNNAIFFCEVVGCHKIILNKKVLKFSWLISKPIYIKNSNITIYLSSNIDCKNNKTLCFYEISWCIYYPKFIVPQFRFQLIKPEILRNLPIVNIYPNDLYIHIRGGDIFKDNVRANYAQPPLCYYEKVLNNNNNFNHVYIISMDHSNVVLDALILKYKNIIYKKNSLKYDISLLCHAFNLVVSCSSFAFSSIKINDNLKNLWEFDIIRLSSKFLFHHHHIFKFRRNYNIYTMKPSEIYRKKMFAFKNTKEQLKLMLEDNCTSDFITTK